MNSRDEEIGFVPVDGFDGAYLIDREARVFSRITKRYLKASPTKKGYLTVGLTRDKAVKNLYVHRLVANAFLGSGEGLQVNHRNGDKLNNRAENLEWMTCTENIRHAWRTGLQTPMSSEEARRVRSFRGRAAISKATGGSQ